MQNQLNDVIGAFQCSGRILSATPYGTGHINDTYAVTIEHSMLPVRYILQRINHHVFLNPSALMANIERVTQHVRKTLEAAGQDDIERRTLTLIPTKTEKMFHVDTNGNHWRMYIFIEGAKTFDELETTDQAYEAAKAFGCFMKQLRTLPGAPLVETIPRFHDTRARFCALHTAIETDSCNRAAGIAREIHFANQREDRVDTLLNLQRSGKIPLVTTHNDTKLNNVMLDDTTGAGICVIDLDTVMPGLSLYDFGDMVRTAMVPCPEDETDLSKVVGRIEMFEAITRGYLTAAGDTLNQTEKDHLAFSAQLITFETGIRFLTDYLEGDVYFKTHREGHNLDRARVQFAMVQSMEEQSDAMQRIVKSCDASC